MRHRKNYREYPTPLVIVLSLLMMLLVALTYAYYEHDYIAGYTSAQRDRVTSELSALRSNLANTINLKLQLPRIISNYIQVRGAISEAEFQKLAQQIINESGEGVRSIQVTRGTTITFVYPLKGNEQVRKLDLLSLPYQAPEVRQTIQSGRMYMAGPLDLVQGGKGVVVRKPIYLSDEDGKRYFWGLATIVLDWQPLIQNSGLLDANSKIQVAMRERSTGDGIHSPFFGRDSIAFQNPVSLTLYVPDHYWELLAIPRDGWQTVAPDTWFHRMGALFLALITGLFGVWRLGYPKRLRRDVDNATHELQTIRDNLEQRVAERTSEVIESERQRRTLLDNVPFPLVVTRIVDGKNLYINDLASQLFEVPSGSTGQLAPDYYVNSEDRNSFISKLLADGNLVNYEAHMQTNKGRQFYALLSAVRIRYDNSDAILVSANDITERKRIELALKGSEENFRKVFEFSPAPIAISRISDGRILQLNSAAMELFAVEDVPYEKLYAGDYYVNIEDRQRYISTLMSQGSVKNFELQMRDHDGRVYDLLMFSVPLEFHAEPAALISLTDITTRKEAERRLQQANIEAEQAVRAKSEFLATMSHEIRTPLNGALTMLKVLERTELSKKQREYVEAISLSGESLLMILNDVLDLSKIEAGMLEIESAEFDLRELCNEMVLLMGPLAERSHLELHLEIDAAIPLSLKGDAIRIRQVLFNLMGNAIKFTASGSITLSVTELRSQDGSSDIKIAVHDTGIGINAELREKLFAPFTQIDSTIARRYGGTGLGLAICRRLVDAMGGEIGVESVPDRGSTFWFILHLQHGQSQSKNLGSAVSRDELWRDFQLKILLVEDNDINRRAATALLMMDGCKVDAVTNGLDALALLSGNEYDLVLMDIHMPGIDGLETTRRLRNTKHANRSVPVIALTADITQENLQECLAIGMDAVLTKPINTTKLHEALTSIDVARDRARQAKASTESE